MEVGSEVRVCGVLPVGLPYEVGELVGVLANRWDTDWSSPVVVVEGLEVGEFEEVLFVTDLLRLVNNYLVSSRSGCALSNILGHHKKVQVLAITT